MCSLNNNFLSRRWHPRWHHRYGGLLIVLSIMFSGAPVFAQVSLPSVDSIDLPPLPELGPEDKTTSAVVQAATEFEEFIVTGASKREQSLGNVASAVTVISADRLRRFGYRTVSEALRAVAGLYVIDDRTINRLGIRGLQLLGDYNTRVLVLVDGAAINEPVNAYVGVGYDLPVTIDSIERIEVIRGPVSSVYGTSAFFGIINIVTRSADRSPKGWARVTGSQYGGNDFAGGFAVGGVNEQIRAEISATQRFGETLEIPELAEAGLEDGRTSADEEQALRASVVASYHGAFLQLRGYWDLRELPGAVFDSKPGDERNTFLNTQLLLEGGYSHDFGERLSMTVRGHLNLYRFEDNLIFPDETVDEEEYLWIDQFDAQWGGSELRGRYAILSDDRMGFTAGIDSTFNEIDANSYAPEYPDFGEIELSNSYNAQGIYGEFDAAPTSWLSFTAGARYDRHSVFEERLSPRAALFVQGEKYGAKLLYGEGFRNPSWIEVFLEDGVAYIPNPNLRAEVIRGYETVLWTRPTSGLNLRLSGFRWQLDNLIEGIDIPVLDENGNPLMEDGAEVIRTQFQNNNEAVSLGAEFEMSYRNVAGWYGFANGTYTTVEFTDPSTMTDTPAVNSPTWTASAGLSTPLIAGLAHLSTDLFYVGERDTRDPDVTADAHVGWNVNIFAPKVYGFDVTIGVRNLLGKREEIPASVDFDRTEVAIPVIPGEGREFYGRIGYRM